MNLVTFVKAVAELSLQHLKATFFFTAGLEYSSSCGNGNQVKPLIYLIYLLKHYERVYVPKYSL